MTGRGGKSVVVLVVLLAVVMLVGGLSWWLSADRSGKHAAAETVGPAGSNTESKTAEDPGPDRSSQRTQAAHVPKPKTTATDATPQSGEPDELTTGAITIHLTGADGKPFVGDWTLEIEDTESAAKKDPGARRTLEQHAPSAAVNVRPGVVHSVCAYATGMASLTQRCQLPPQRPVAEVELKMQPAPAMLGRVIDADGAGARGLDVWLVPGFVTQSGHTSAPPMTRAGVTDASGGFKVGSLLPGRWNVLVGPRDNPTARANNVTVAGQDVTIEPITLPRLYSVVVRVKDEQGHVVPGVAVTGRGSVGGAVEGTSDGGGDVAFDLLPAGRWRVFANTTDGKRGVSMVDVPLQSGGVIEVVVRTMPAVGDRR